jgi:hypothetical protein
MGNLKSTVGDERCVAADVRIALAVLGLPDRGVTIEDAGRQYRRCAMTVHPGKSGIDWSAEMARYTAAMDTVRMYHEEHGNLDVGSTWRAWCSTAFRARRCHDGDAD